MRLRKLVPMSTLSIVTYHHISERGAGVPLRSRYRGRRPGAVPPPGGDARAVRHADRRERPPARHRGRRAAEEPGDDHVRRRLPVVPRRGPADPEAARRARHVLHLDVVHHRASPVLVGAGLAAPGRRGATAVTIRYPRPLEIERADPGLRGRLNAIITTRVCRLIWSGSSARSPRRSASSGPPRSSRATPTR